jgi:putative transposase
MQNLILNNLFQFMTSLSDVERARALERFHALRPFLEDGVPLAQVASKEGIDLRTAQRWVKRYRTHGLVGLARKSRREVCRVAQYLRACR